MRLATLQSAVLEDLTDLGSRSPEERARTFAAPPAGGVETRWHVYASGYVARLVEALENDYPATRRILGEGSFRSLSARYARRCPPRSFDIGRAGDRLAQFLETDPLALDLPFLPDLARFEWALAEAFVARDETPLAWSDVARMSPEAVAEMTLRLRAGTAVLRSPWPLFDLRDCQDLADEQVSIPVEGRPVNAVVFRRGLEVLRRAAGEVDARFLERARDGVSLAQLTEEPAFHGDAARLPEVFRAWVMEGVLCRTGEPAALPSDGRT